MFKRRKFKLKFKKACKFVDIGVYNEINDSDLMKVILQLQQKYDFDMVKTNFKDCFGKSYIIIKCNKEYKNKIFSEYCIKLSGWIEHVSF